MYGITNIYNYFELEMDFFTKTAICLNNINSRRSYCSNRTEQNRTAQKPQRIPGILQCVHRSMEVKYYTVSKVLYRTIHVTKALEVPQGPIPKAQNI